MTVMGMVKRSGDGNGSGNSDGNRDMVVMVKVL